MSWPRVTGNVPAPTQCPRCAVWSMEKLAMRWAEGAVKELYTKYTAGRPPLCWILVSDGSNTETLQCPLMTGPVLNFHTA